jgi:predicted nucleic acid-binding protein
MIIDTDVLIWLLRGNKKARDTVLKAAPFSISVITLMELIQGSRNKEEQLNIVGQLNALGSITIHINDNISERAAQYIREYSLSHALMIPDAIIAATVIERKETLLTGNSKHFEYIPGVKVKRFRA